MDITSYIGIGIVGLTGVVIDSKMLIDFRKELNGFSPDVIAITTMSVDFDYAVESARIARSCMPDAKIVVGGPHPSIVPQELAPNVDIDYIMVGEGEVSFINLLKDIENGARREKHIEEGLFLSAVS